jgi:hypothetical protein
MKTYKFTDSGVLVDGKPLVLKRMKNEPEQHVSPDRIALSILCDCTDNAAAMLHAREFQKEIIAHCKVGEEILSDEVQEWNDFKCQIGASVQSAAWTPNGAEPPPVGGTPWRLPRLLRVQREPPDKRGR